MSTKDKLVKQHYSDILSDLLKKKNLQDIAVSEIIDASGFSRSTFYRNFRDKYELANWNFKNLMEEMRDTVINVEKVEMIHLEILRFIDINRQSFKRLILYADQNSFSEYYFEVAFEWAHLHSIEIDRKRYFQDYYTLIYNGSGYLGVIKDWLESDDPLTPEELNDIIELNRTDGIRNLFVTI